MSSAFKKIAWMSVWIFLVLAALLLFIRFLLLPDSADNMRLNPTVVIDSSTGGSSVTVQNPARSANFTDIGSNTYVSDERQLGSGIGYSVSYFADDNSFAIDISGKPVGQYREAASRYLLETLQITEAQACQLRIYVGVSFDTDPTMSGQNLGLSFCPGAVNL